MKITQGGIAKFIESGASKARVILMYGTEEALMLGHIHSIKTALKSHEFTSIETEGENYLSNLSNEALTHSMFGESKILHVHNFRKLDGKKITDLLGKIDENSPHLIILSHPTTLEATNSIRKLCEATPHFVAVGIYTETDANLKESAKNIMTNLGVAFEPQVPEALAQMYHGNGTILKQELEKLHLYLLSQPQMVTVEIITRVLQEDSHANVFDIPSLILDGNLNKAYSILDNAQHNDTPAIVIFATISNHIKKVYFVKKALMQPENEGVDILLKKQGVFFQQVGTFKKHIGMYSVNQLVNIFNRLNTLEAQTRSSTKMAYNSIKNFAVNVCSLRF